jgi:hypothetical protein
LRTSRLSCFLIDAMPRSSMSFFCCVEGGKQRDVVMQRPFKNFRSRARAAAAAAMYARARVFARILGAQLCCLSPPSQVYYARSLYIHIHNRIIPKTHTCAAIRHDHVQALHGAHLRDAGAHLPRAHDSYDLGDVAIHEGCHNMW